MLLDLRTLGIKPDVRRLFVYDNRMFAERAFYCMGRPLYERYGFAKMEDEMELVW